MKVGENSFLRDQVGWRILVENDANLAAWAERGSGRVDPDSTFVTLLADDSLGSGIVFEGQLQRGAHGTAGEMGYVKETRGVDTVDGIKSVRKYYQDELRQRGDTMEEHVTAADVLLLAQQGNEAAVAAVNRIVGRLSRVIATIASLIDPGVLVLAGRFAEHAGPLVEMINWRLADLRTPSPPIVIASALGGEVVLRGAIEMAIDDIRAGVSFAANGDGPLEGTLRKAPRG